MSNGVTESVSTAIDRDRLSGAKLSAWIKSPERSASELAAFEGRSTALDRLIASHECASTETLSRLSHSSDRATRSRVCKNPNTPTAEYLRLGQQFPVEFLANPILDFLLLENPALLKEASSSLLIRLLKSKQCPEAFLVWAASHPEEKVQLAVAMNPSLPQRAIDPLKASANPRVREAAEATELGDLTPEKAEQAFVQALAKRIAQLDREAFTEAWKKKDIGLAQWPLLTLGMKLELIGWQLTSEFAVTEILELFAKEPASRFRRQVADNRNTPPALLDTLSKDVDAEVREAVASNPAILINTLALLALDPDSNVRRAVAKNTNTPIHVLETLAGDLAQEVRAEVGGNTNTSEQVLETLAKDAEKWVRSVVASNKNAKARVLETLATDIEEDVRHSVGLNPNTPAAVLEALARDLSSRVRSGVANNPNTPPNVLEILAKDMHDYVKWLVSLNPNTSELVLETLAEHTEARVRSGVASNRNTPVAVLETLCRDSDYDVWRKTCSNPNTPLAALDKLANAPSLWIRVNFASSNFAHGAPLLRLAKDTHIRVREAVAQNRNTPALVLETLARDQYEGVCRAVAQNPNTPAFVLETLARVQYEGVRRAVAQNVNTPAPLLALLSRHRNFQIRLAVTRNPSTPSQALKDLACDTDVRISVEALQHKSLDSVTALKAIEYLTNRNGSWYQKQLKKVSIDERKAIESCNVLFFSGKDPNHSVLAKRALAPIMALCAGPYIEPSRIAKVVSSSDWLVRAAVARNRGTPENLLKRLA